MSLHNGGTYKIPMLIDIRYLTLDGLSVSIVYKVIKFIRDLSSHIIAIKQSLIKK